MKNSYVNLNRNRKYTKAIIALLLLSFLFLISYNSSLSIYDVRTGNFTIVYIMESYFVVVLFFIISIVNFFLQVEKTNENIGLVFSLFFFQLFSMLVFSITRDDILTDINIILWSIVIFVFIYSLRISDKKSDNYLFVFNIVYTFVFVASTMGIILYYLNTLNIFGITFSQVDEYDRATGWFGNPNRYGTIAGLTCLLSVIYIVFRKKTIHLIGLLIGFFALYISESNGAMLSLLLSVTILFRLTRNKIFYFLVTLVTLIVLLLISNQIIYFPLQELSNGRLQIWEQMYSFWIMDVKYVLTGGVNSSIVGYSAHNSFLHVLFGYGVFSFILMLLTFFSVFYINYKAKNIHWTINTSIIFFFAFRSFSSSNLFSIHLEYALFIIFLAAFKFIDITNKSSER